MPDRSAQQIGNPTTRAPQTAITARATGSARFTIEYSTSPATISPITPVPITETIVRPTPDQGPHRGQAGRHRERSSRRSGS